jgi:hypothetical protein
MAVSTIGTKFAKLTKATATQFRTLSLFKLLVPSAPRATADRYIDGIDLVEAVRGSNTGISAAYVAKAAAYTVTASDYAVFVSAAAAARTITLPPAADNPGRKLFIKCTNGTNDVTVDGNASETVGGSTTQVLTATDDYLEIISDGTNWQILHSVITV